ncbi:MAG: hypothetical protein K6T61_15575 [Bryobacteraceae bacterium]|nr:hypothetical protein [Bryobacteraceae bacterium]
MLPFGIITSTELSVSFRKVTSIANMIFGPSYSPLDNEPFGKQVVYKSVRNSGCAVVPNADRWRIQKYEHIRAALWDAPSAGIGMILPMWLKRRVAAFHG